MSSARVCITGDWRSILPTPAAWRVAIVSFSTVSTMAAGMLRLDETLAEIGGKGAQPHDIGFELAQAVIGGNVHGVEVGGLTTPVSISPCRAWNRFTPAST